MKIIDCFPFFNEIDLLYYRMSILYKYVDYFVICESTLTFSGIEKPSFFMENVEKFAPFYDKIIHVIDTKLVPKRFLMPGSGAEWHNDQHQRNYINAGIIQVPNIEDSDILMISDLDEIPDPALYKRIRRGEVIVDTIKKLRMDMYVYNLSTRQNNSWGEAKILPYSEYKTRFNSSPQNCRMCQDNVYVVDEVIGWHLTFFGDENQIRNKIISYAHQEKNTTNFTDVSKIKNRIKNRIDVFDRPEHDQLLTHVPISDNKYLPKKYEKYLAKFAIE